MEELKLFVWEGDGVLTDYTNGMICVLAHDLEEALRLIEKEGECTANNFPVLNYKVIEKPKAFICWGGG